MYRECTEVNTKTLTKWFIAVLLLNIFLQLDFTEELFNSLKAKSTISASNVPTCGPKSNFTDHRSTNTPLLIALFSGLGLQINPSTKTPAQLSIQILITIDNSQSLQVGGLKVGTRLLKNETSGLPPLKA